MGSIWLIGDPHFGHKNVGNFRNEIGINSEKENVEAICDNWQKLITKRDKVIVLGDGCFTPESLNIFKSLNGLKDIVLGNHDYFKKINYHDAFQNVRGVCTYKDAWLSHIPIHPNCFRKKGYNIHAHLHFKSIDGELYHDPRYINVSCDHLYKTTGKFLARYADLINS